MDCCSDSCDRETSIEVERYVGNVKRASASNAGNLVVTRKVKQEYEEKYHDWCERIEDALAERSGFVSVEIFPPVPGGQQFYTHLVKFDTLKDVIDWRSSETCKAFMNEVEEYTIDVDIHILRSDHASSLVWGIRSENSDHPHPIPWKQFTAVLSCLWPTASLLDYILSHFFHAVGKTPIPVKMIVNIVLNVAILVFFLIPNYMKIFDWWVFQKHDLLTELKVVIPTVIMIAAILLLVIFFRKYD